MSIACDLSKDDYGHKKYVESEYLVLKSPKSILCTLIFLLMPVFLAVEEGSRFGTFSVRRRYILVVETLLALLLINFKCDR